MKNNKGNQIREKAIELLRATPEGINYAELQRQLKVAFPDSKAIRGFIWDLDARFSSQVKKPDRGRFVYIGVGAAPDAGKAKPAAEKPAPAKVKKEVKKATFKGKKEAAPAEAPKDDFNYTAVKDDPGLVPVGDKDVQEELAALPGFQEHARASANE